jgi:hypothetical protein
MLLGRVGPEVHCGRIVPQEEGLSFVVDLLDEGERVLSYLVIDGFHALFGKRTGILDRLSALAIGPAVKHAPRSELLPERRVLRIVRLLRFLFGVEVV